MNDNEEELVKTVDEVINSNEQLQTEVLEGEIGNDIMDDSAVTIPKEKEWEGENEDEQIGEGEWKYDANALEDTTVDSALLEGTVHHSDLQLVDSEPKPDFIDSEPKPDLIDSEPKPELVDSEPKSESVDLELKPEGDMRVEIEESREDDKHVPSIREIEIVNLDEKNDQPTLRTEEEIISDLDDLDLSSDSEDKHNLAENELMPPSDLMSDTSHEDIENIDSSEKYIEPMKSLVLSSSSEDERKEKGDAASENHSKDLSIQRNELLEQCRCLLSERKQLRRKNIILHKKLHDYFKKKKAEGTYHEGESGIVGGGPAELQYRKKLLVFYELLTKEANQKAQILNESKEMLDARDAMQADSVAQLEQLLKQEETLGHGLIDSQTGKVLSDKAVLQLIHRQEQLNKQLSESMIKYIRIRNEVTQLETALKSLEDLGEGFHLIDYEQLRVENQSLHDKIEERDNELTHLREKIEASILTMAHMEEKTFGTDQLVSECIEQLRELELNLKESRRKKTTALKRLICIRSEIDRLQHEAGLLAYHSLLRDFESVLQQLEHLECEVHEMENHVMQGKILTPSSYKLKDSRSSSEVSTEASCDRERMSPAGREPGKNELKKARHRITGKQSDDLMSSIHPDQQKPKLMRGRPSIENLLAQQEK